MGVAVALGALVAVALGALVAVALGALVAVALGALVAVAVARGVAVAVAPAPLNWTFQARSSTTAPFWLVAMTVTVCCPGGTLAVLNDASQSAVAWLRANGDRAPSSIRKTTAVALVAKAFTVIVPL